MKYESFSYVIIVTKRPDAFLKFYVHLVVMNIYIILFLTIHIYIYIYRLVYLYHYKLIKLNYRYILSYYYNIVRLPLFKRSQFRSYILVSPDRIYVMKPARSSQPRTGIYTHLEPFLTQSVFSEYIFKLQKTSCELFHYLNNEWMTFIRTQPGLSFTLIICPDWRIYLLG